MKTWFLGFIIPLISHLTHEERDLRNNRSLIQQQNKKIDQKKKSSKQKQKQIKCKKQTFQVKKCVCGGALRIGFHAVTASLHIPFYNLSPSSIMKINCPVIKIIKFLQTVI